MAWLFGKSGAAPPKRVERGFWVKPLPELTPEGRDALGLIVHNPHVFPTLYSQVAASELAHREEGRLNVGAGAAVHRRTYLRFTWPLVVSGAGYSVLPESLNPLVQFASWTARLSGRAWMRAGTYRAAKALEAMQRSLRADANFQALPKEVRARLLIRPLSVEGDVLERRNLLKQLRNHRAVYGHIVADSAWSLLEHPAQRLARSVHDFRDVRYLNRVARESLERIHRLRAELRQLQALRVSRRMQWWEGTASHADTIEVNVQFAARLGAGKSSETNSLEKPISFGPRNRSY